MWRELGTFRTALGRSLPCPSGRSRILLEVGMIHRYLSILSPAVTAPLTKDKNGLTFISRSSLFLTNGSRVMPASRAFIPTAGRLNKITIVFYLADFSLYFINNFFPNLRTKLFIIILNIILNF